MRTIAIINQKGGCGKTTTAINLSAMLARAGKRTLLADLDSQSHCAAGLGIPESKIEMDIGDAMLAVGNKPIDTARLLWRPSHNFDLAPSRMRLAGLEASRGGLANLPDKERRLALAIDEIALNHDIVCVDCAPSIGLLTYNALVAADVVLIPVETSFFSLQGATRQVNTVKSLSRKLGISRQVWILPTIHDEQNKVASDLLDELYRRFAERVIPVVIRRDTRLREAASFGQSIIDYAPGCPAFEDYSRLADWVIRHWSVSAQVDAALSESLANLDPLAPTQVDEEFQDQGDSYVSEQTEGLYAQPAADGYVTSSADAQLADVTASQPGQRTPAFAGLNPAQTNYSDAIPLRPAPSRVGQFQRATAPGTVEVKPGHRAEEVARRATDFLRKAAQARLSPNVPTPPDAQRPAPRDSGRNLFTGQPGPGQPGQSGQPGTPAPLNSRSDDARGPAKQPTPAERPGNRPVHAAARRLLGAQQTTQGMLFVQPANSGNVMHVAGTFNNWDPTSHPMQRNDELGVFELCLRLPPGTYAYRLVTDGVWTPDPYNNNCEIISANETNSLIVVNPSRSDISISTSSPEQTLTITTGEPHR